VLALINQMLPRPSIWRTSIRVPSDYVPNKAIAHSFDIGLSNSLAWRHQRLADHAALDE